MSSSDARLDALCRLATALGAGEPSLHNVELAWNQPDQYLQKFAERLGDRGITEAIPDLPFIALIDALIGEKRCIERDWRTEPEELVKSVRALLRRRGLKDWKAPKLAHEEIEGMLRAIGSSLGKLGVELCTLDHQSDSVSLVLLAMEDVESATELARQADFGRLACWTEESGTGEPAAPVRVGEEFFVPVPSSVPPRQFFALPGRRMVLFDGSTLLLASAEGLSPIELDAELLPGFELGAKTPEYVLVRTGQAFGLLSRQYVRLWSSSADAVLYRNEPALEPNERGAFPGVTAGGVSGDPQVVVASFHRAHAEAEDVHPAVLRLDEPARVAHFEALNEHGRLGRVSRDRLPMSSELRLKAQLRRTPRLGCIAWIDGAPYVVARGREESSPSYAVFGRYYPPFGHLEPLIDLGVDCTTRVTASRQHLFAWRPNQQHACAVYSVNHPSRAAFTLELPPQATLLDHEDDGFWYFEPTETGGRIVFAMLT